MRRAPLLTLGILSAATLLLALGNPGRSQPRAGETPAFQPLWPNGAPGAKGTTDSDIPGLFVYPAVKDKATGAAVVVCPGGGYGGLAMSYEGHDVARWLSTQGITGVVLRYRLAPKYRHPVPLTDAGRAIRTVRARADEWGIDSQRIGILGFSAGGHLASTAGTHFDAGKKDAEDFIDRQGSRPDFMILAYPVITLTDPFTHGGSRSNLLGPSPDPKLIEDLSNEKQVTAQTPPAFLVHTTEDTAVPPENSVLFYLALHKNRVPAELHVYEKGRHGLGMGPRDMPFSSWPDRCLAWMKGRGLLEATAAPLIGPTSR